MRLRHTGTPLSCSILRPLCMAFGMNILLVMKKIFNWFLSHRYWSAIGVFIAIVVYFFPQPVRMEQEPENTIASPILDCYEKKTRCQSISELIARKESEFKEIDYRNKQLSGDISVNIERQEGNVPEPNSAEIARQDELNQLHDQIVELKNELHQCEKTECSNYSKE